MKPEYRKWLQKVRRKAGHYQNCFLDPAGNLTAAGFGMLKDFRRFCYMDRPTTIVSPVTRAVDPLASAHADGRREACLRIQRMLRLNDRDLAKLLEETDDA